MLSTLVNRQCPIVLHDNARPYVSWWHCRSSLTWDMRICYIYLKLLFSQPPNAIYSIIYALLRKKNPKQFCSIRELETAFKYFFAFRILSYGDKYLVNWWQKYIYFQGSYFDWLKHCLSSLIQKSNSFKIGHNFPNNQINFLSRFTIVNSFLGTKILRLKQQRLEDWY